MPAGACTRRPHLRVWTPAGQGAGTARLTPTGRRPTKPTPRLLTLDDVAEILNVSWSQAYALVRRKELIAIQIGWRGQWRVEVGELQRFIQRKYAEARAGTVPDAAAPADAADDGEAGADPAAIVGDGDTAPAAGRRRA